jgi:hypothetical protein
MTFTMRCLHLPIVYEAGNNNTDNNYEVVPKCLIITFTNAE